MKLKICHMTSVHKSDDVRIFQKECVWLAKNTDYRIFLIAPGDSKVKNKVEIIGVGEKPNNRLVRVFSFTKKIYKRALEVDADIYHIHDPELLIYALRLKKKGKKVIFDSHEYTYGQIQIKEYIPKVIRKITAKAYKVFEDKVCKNIDAVIFPCKIEGKHPFTDIAKKVEFIGNYPEINLYHPQEKGLKYDVCYTGSLTEERGITNLLKAAQLAKASVGLAGVFATEDYKLKLKSQRLMENVDYKGLISHDEVVDLVNQSRICVSVIKPVGQYSMIENLPTKVYEAMALKKPIIMSNFPYPRKVNQESNFGILVDANNIKEIAKAINKIQSQSDLALYLGENGRKLIEKRFSWELEIKKLINLYESLY